MGPKYLLKNLLFFTKLLYKWGSFIHFIVAFSGIWYDYFIVISVRNVTTMLRVLGMYQCVVGREVAGAGGAHHTRLLRNSVCGCLCYLNDLFATFY